MKTWRLGLLSGVATLLALPNAQADLLEYSFTDTLGEQKVLQPGSEYANPVSDLTFTLSGGVDRKVRLLIRDEEGAVVSSASSELLGANDRILVDGGEFYGERLQLPVPADGSYEFVAQIISTDGTVVSEQVDPVTVHTTPPTSGGFDVDQSRPTEAPGFPYRLIGGRYFSSLQINGIVSTIPLTTAEIAVKDMEADKLIGIIQTPILEGTAFLQAKDLFASGAESTFELVAKVRDIAGNESEISEMFYYDSASNKRGSLEAFAIYDPENAPVQPLLNDSKFEGFVPFTSGMIVSQNPFRLLARVPKENYKDFSPFGLGYLWDCNNPCFAEEPFHTDDDFVYLDTATPYTSRDAGLNRFLLYSTDLVRNPNSSTFEVKLSDSTAVAPRIMDLKVGFKGIDTLRGGRRLGLEEKDWIINRASVTVAPRPYRQRIIVDNVSTSGNDADVEIEPNESIVTVDIPEYSPYEYRLENNRRYRTTVRARVYTLDLPLELKRDDTYITFDSNFTPPEVNEITVFRQEKEVHVEVNEDDGDIVSGATAADINWFVSPTKSKLELRSAGGDFVEVPFKSEVQHTHWKRRFIYDLSEVPGGEYTHLKMTAVDAENNTTVKEIPEAVSIDNTAPTVQFNLADGIDVATLDDITVTVGDDVDDNPQVASVRLTGGPLNDQINLPVREVGQSQYQLEYPVLFPSYEAGTGYSVVVTAKDAHGNTSEGVLGFSYKPPRMALEGGFDGKYLIPAVAAELVHKDGSRLIETVPLTYADGAPVNGTYDVFAALRSDAPSAYMVNGVRIEPGQTQEIVSNHDFTASSGRLSVGAYPAEAGIEGTAHILVMTTIANSPVLSAELTTWVAQAKLDAPDWTVRQGVDRVLVQASPDQGTPCRFTTSTDEAYQSDPIYGSICEFVWTQLPDESEQVLSDASDLEMMQVDGVAYALGPQTVSYELALYNGDGSRLVVGSGAQDLDVVTAEGSVSLAPTDSLNTVYRGIENVAVQLQQVDGAACPLTIHADEAARRNECLVEWVGLPAGLEQNASSQPYLTGRVQDEGVNSIAWQVSKFTPSGQPVLLNAQSVDIEALTPPAPQVELADGGSSDRIVFVPLEGDQATDIVVSAPASDLLIDIKRDSAGIFNEKFTLSSKDNNRVNLALEPEGLQLWQEQQFDVTASYSELAGVEGSLNVTVVGVPIETVVPSISVEQRDAVNTDLLPVTISLRDKRKTEREYDASVMGQWEGRVVYDTPSGPVELTQFEPLEGDTLVAMVDLSAVDKSSLRLYAEVRLISEHAGYQRTVQSVSPAFVAILLGNAIDGNVVSQRFSGPAPLSTYFKLKVDNSVQRRAIGDVIWQVSEDDGATWTDFIPEHERSRTQYKRDFDMGTYLVRAQIENLNSGAISYTPQTQVTAYEELDVELTGPKTVMVGSDGTLVAEVSKDGVAAPEEDYVLEWSMDGGKTFAAGSGNELVIEGIDEGVQRVHARVRSVEAPADDRYAYMVDRHTVGVRRVKPARATLYGSRKLEIGQTYEFSARLYAPYRDMNVAVKGEFVFPDGTVVEGESGSYTVREEDTQDGKIAIGYTAWLEGFKAETSKSVELSARVWAYEWPDFMFGVSTDTNQAPATVKASLRAVGDTRKLEEAVFEWVLPDEASQIVDRSERYRTFVIEKAGDYEIVAKISDARGNETVLRETLSLEPAPAYEVGLSFTPSNPYLRAPLSVFLRPQVSGGHPRDRVASYTYSVNGEVLEANGSYARAELEAGENMVELEVMTKMGVVATGELVIPVADNQPPVCDLEITETSRSWIGKAKCEDVDGRVVRHNWHVDGYKVSVSGSRISISKHEQEQLPLVTLSAIDDAGAVSEEVTLSHAVN